MFNFSSTNSAQQQSSIQPMFQNWGNSNNNQQQQTHQLFQNFQFQQGQNNLNNAQGFMNNQNSGFNTNDPNFFNANQQHSGFGTGFNQFQNNFNQMPQNTNSYISQNQPNIPVTNSDAIGSAVVSYLFPNTNFIPNSTQIVENQAQSTFSTFHLNIYQQIDQIAQKMCLEVMLNKKNQDYEKIWSQVTKSQIKQIDQDLKQFIVKELLAKNNIPSENMKQYYQMKIDSRTLSRSTIKKSEDRPSIFSSLKRNFKKTETVEENESKYNPRFYQNFSQHHYIHKQVQPEKKTNELTFRQIQLKTIQTNQSQRKLKQKQKLSALSLQYNVFSQRLMYELCANKDDLPIPGSYSLKPTLEEISHHSSQEIKKFPNLKISNQIGEIIFRERINLFRKNIDKCIQISKYQIEILDEEWQDKGFEATFYNFGNFDEESKKMLEQIEKEQTENESKSFEGNEKKKEKMIKKSKIKSRAAQLRKAFEGSIKKWAELNNYQLKNLDIKSGNITIKL